MESVFKGWTDFYVIIGSAAAALTGLVFVVMTLVADRAAKTEADEGPSSEGTSVYSTTTVVLFSTAFFLSAITAMPWPTAACGGVLIGIGGLLGVAYFVRASLRGLRLELYQPDAEDRTWFMLLPTAAYAVLAFAGFSLAFGEHYAPFILALTILAMLVIGIHNAWDVGVYIAINRDE